MPSYDSRNPYRPLFGSLAEEKAARLAKRAVKKERRIQPLTASQVAASTGIDPNLKRVYATDLGDVAIASGYRALGSFSDMGAYASNKIFGTDFDDTTEEGWSNSEVAASLAGVRPGAVARGQELQQETIKALAEDRYADAGINALMAAPYSVADSAAVVPEIAAGTVLTALTAGATAPLLGKRIYQIGKGAVELKDTYDAYRKTAQAAPLLSKGFDIAKQAKGFKKFDGKYKEIKSVTQRAEDLVRKGIGTAAKAAGQVSLVSADMTAQQINEYRKIHGKDPSTSRVATMYLTNTATMAVEPTIIKNFFIPKFTKEFVREQKRLIKAVSGKSNLNAILARTADAAIKAAKAGGAEVAQEYIQTWQEILVTKVPETDLQNWKENILAQLQNPQNQVEALGGALLGGAAGGATRGAISTPLLAAGNTANVAVGAAKTGAKAAKWGAEKIATKTYEKSLSESDRAVLRDRYESEKKITDKKVADIDVAVDTVKKAKSINDLMNDPNLSKVVTSAQVDLDYTDNEAANPKNFKRIKKKAIANLRAQQLGLKTNLETSRAARVAKQVSKKTPKRFAAAAKKFAEENDVPVNELAAQVKEFGTRAVEAVKSLDSSAARGVTNYALKYGEEKIGTIVRQARNLDSGELTRVIAAVEKKHPNVAKQLNKELNKIKKSAEFFGTRSDNIIDQETINPAIKRVAEDSNLDEKNIASISRIIDDAFTKKIGDYETTQTLRKALDNYKNSSAYKNKAEGVISERTMAVFEKRLKAAERRYKLPKTLDEFVKVVEERGIEEVLNDNETIKKLKEKFNAKTAKEFTEKLKEYVPDYVSNLGDTEIARRVADYFKSDTEKTSEEVKTSETKETKETKSSFNKHKENKTKTEKYKKKLAKTLTTVNNAMAHPEEREGMREAINQLAIKFAEDGITREEIDEILSTYPNIAKDPIARKALENAAEPDTVTHEIDEAEAKAVTEKEGNKLYNELFPECK